MLAVTFLLLAMHNTMVNSNYGDVLATQSNKHKEIPVQRALKFSQVFGQTSLNSSMVIRPAVNNQTTTHYFNDREKFIRTVSTYNIITTQCNQNTTF